MSLFARKERMTKIRPMTAEDVESVRDVGQIAWSDLAMHDIGRKFKYPRRSDRIIDAYMWTDPGGCLVADEDGKVVGSAFCHTLGKVGWIGPLEVLPSHQDHGIGKALLASCESHLVERDCQVIGLETMAHLPKHLHFYMSSGYRPGQMTLIMEKILHHEPDPPTAVEEMGPSTSTKDLQEITRLSGMINPQLDYSSEVRTILEKHLGSIYTIRAGEELQGFALLHTYQRGEEASYSSVKALVVDPLAEEPQRIFEALMTRCERTSLEQGKNRLLTRFAAGDLRLYNTMIARAYVLKGANIRMVKRGDYDERGGFNITSWAG